MGTDFVIAAVVALVLYRLYRRGRSLIGQQTYAPKAMKRRLWSLGIVLLLILWADVAQVQAGLPHGGMALAVALVATLAGLAGGSVLGWHAARLAELGWQEGELKLRAHAWLGPAILVLYFVRVAYKFWLMHRLGILGSLNAAAPEMQQRLAEFDLNPISSLLRGLVFAYYFTYYPLLMRRAGRMQPVAVEPDQL